MRGMFLAIILAYTIQTDISIHLQNPKIPEELIQHIYDYQMANLSLPKSKMKILPCTNNVLTKILYSTVVNSISGTPPHFNAF